VLNLVPAFESESGKKEEQVQGTIQFPFLLLFLYFEFSITAGYF
jgi:hypothetical protein